MLKHEFEGLIDSTVSDELYEKIEEVYMYYPGIETKQQIADLFLIGGENLIEDLRPRAFKIMKLEEKRIQIAAEIEKVKSTPEWGHTADD